MISLEWATRGHRSLQRLRLVSTLLPILTMITGCVGVTGQRSLPEPRLHVECTGTRSLAPTVILESGALGTASDWGLVMRDLSSGGRVCAYTRAGLGASRPRTRAPTAEAITDNLRRVLEDIDEPDPVILVGHSNGALYAEAFARRWPGRVAGLVYVDGVNTTALASPKIVQALRVERWHIEFARIAGELGLAPALAQESVASMGLRGRAAERKRRALTSETHLRASAQEERLIMQALRATAMEQPLPSNIPIVVLIAAEDPNAPLAKAWRSVQLASAIPAQQHWILDMPGATHVSPLGRDRAYVVAAVDWLRHPADDSALGNAAFAHTLP